MLNVLDRDSLFRNLYSFINTTSFQINSNGVGGGNVFVEALSPSGKLKKCDVAENEGVYTATFTPDEIGKSF